MQKCLHLIASFIVLYIFPLFTVEAVPIILDMTPAGTTWTKKGDSIKINSRIVNWPYEMLVTHNIFYIHIDPVSNREIIVTERDKVTVSKYRNHYLYAMTHYRHIEADLTIINRKYLIQNWFTMNIPRDQKESFIKSSPACVGTLARVKCF